MYCWSWQGRRIMSERCSGVSVIVPTFNRAAMVSRAIDSILAQTRPVREIIVVDDGSTDNTEQVIRKYGVRVRYIRQENAGVSAARNRGIKAVTGEWIAFLDSDDEWFPEKIERQLAVLESYPELKWCACGVEVVGNGRVKIRGAGRAAGQLRKYGYLPNYFRACRRGALLHTCGMLVASDLLQKVGFFDTSLMEAEDADLWSRLALESPAIGYVSEPCYRYYLDVTDSLSKGGKTTYSVFRSTDKIFELMKSRKFEAEHFYRRYARDIVFRRLVSEAGQKSMDVNEVQMQLRRCSLSPAHKIIIRLLCVLPRNISSLLEGRIRDFHRFLNQLY